MPDQQNDPERTGIALARAYCTDVVEPLLASAFPAMPYSAGRLGTGSDVLGLDDATSRDHDWGLRLSLFVPPGMAATVDAELARSLPQEFLGLPIRFAFTGAAERRHHVEVGSLTDFLHDRLGFDPRDGIETSDWLSLTGQAVLEVATGPVFADAEGELAEVRRLLRWYPDDVWRYVLASDWSRLEQELPLMGRAADAGDELGSRVIAGRLVQITMHLAFLLDRHWAPYAKWFGTLFARLPLSDVLAEPLTETLDAPSAQQRQAALARALQVLLEKQNALGLSDVAEAMVPFWDRPYLQPDHRIVDQLTASVAGPPSAASAGDASASDGPPIDAFPIGAGSVEQRTDNVAVLVDAAARRALLSARWG